MSYDDDRRYEQQRLDRIADQQRYERQRLDRIAEDRRRELAREDALRHQRNDEMDKRHEKERAESRAELERWIRKGPDAGRLFRILYGYGDSDS